MLACSACGYGFVLVVPGAAAIVVDDGKILLMRRRYTRTAGLWCIPQGKVELDEDVRQTARRELQEETGLEVELRELFFVHSGLDVPGRPVLGVWFKAEVTGGELTPGDDALEVRYFPLEAPPDLAFEADRLVIEKLRTEQVKERTS